jgi:hypothetical protein
MIREKSGENVSQKKRVPMRSTGAEQFVVAVMWLKGHGAKELRHSNRLACQPVRGGANEYGKGLYHTKGVGVGRLLGCQEK